MLVIVCFRLISVLVDVSESILLIGSGSSGVLGIEELLLRDPSLQRHDEAVRILLIATQREAELEEFR